MVKKLKPPRKGQAGLKTKQFTVGIETYNTYTAYNNDTMKEKDACLKQLKDII